MYKLNTENFVKAQGFESFFGVWVPDNELVLDYSGFQNLSGIDFVSGANYYIMSTVFELIDGTRKNLICTDDSGNENISAMLFRGYLLDPPLHSLSENDKLLKYWNNSSKCNHNGVFSAAFIKNMGKTLELVTDAFGIGCLYYRKTGSRIWFSTSPRFLQFENDKPDLIAWRSLLQTGFICGDRALSIDVARVPPGTTMCFHGDREYRNRWFDFSSLPEGTGHVDAVAVETVEQSFTTAMERCLKLKTQDVILPLSSGYDSRRILGYLLDHEISFRSITVSRLTPDGFDLDGVISSAIANELKFSHEQFPLPGVSDFLKNEKASRECLAHESMIHSWFLPAWEKPVRSTLWFDGLCGDTLGHSGLKISGIGRQGPITPLSLQNAMFTPIYDSVLNRAYWPSVIEVKSEFADYLKFLPVNNNFIDISMILHRARRAVSISSQQFCRPGMVVVYPYLDLDYVRSVLAFSPFDRFEKSLQNRCLSRFHPKLFSYFDKEENLISGQKIFQSNGTELNQLEFERQYKHCLNKSGIWELLKLIKLKRKVQLINFNYIHKNERPEWWLKPLLAMVDWKHYKPVYVGYIRK